MLTERLLTVTEASQKCGLTRAQMYEHIRAGCPVEYVEGKPRLRPSSVRAWLAKNEPKPVEAKTDGE